MNFYLLFCKDSFTGRSFDKKMFSLDYSTWKYTSKTIKALYRNISYAI